mgnify:CR=1 FL=1
MMQNPITSFTAEHIAKDFPELKSLTITETHVGSWEELEKLRQFPALTEVRMKNIPLVKVSG